MDKFLVIDLDMDIRKARAHFEKKYILAQIKKFNGNISKTANFIGMDPSVSRQARGILKTKKEIIKSIESEIIYIDEK